MARIAAVGIVLFLGLAALATTRSVGDATHAGWTVKQLDTVGGTATRAVDINGRGEIVGVIDTQRRGENPSYHAFLWAAGHLRDLGTLPLGGRLDMPNSSEAVALNGRGQVIGISQVEMNGPESHAFLWSSGSMSDLGCGGAARARCAIGSFPAAITSGGLVVGWAGDLPESVGERPVRAVAWRHGKQRNLGALATRTRSRAIDVNERGQIVGTSYNLRSDLLQVRTRAFLWQAGRLTDLGALPGNRYSEAVAINERGAVIGISYPTLDYSGGRGFVWRNGRITSLGALQPSDINDSGEIVGDENGHVALWRNGKTIDTGIVVASAGSARIDAQGDLIATRAGARGAAQAVIWRNGATTALPALAGANTSAPAAINNRLQIVGWSGARDGHHHAVLWSPP